MTRLSPARAYVAALVLMTAAIVGTIIAAGLPWLVLAVVLGVVATRGWGRTAIGVLISAAGVGSLLACVLGSIPGSPVIGTASGALLAIVGAWTAVSGRSWPAMGTRYDAGPSPSPRARALSAWEAQDRGIDPTADASD